MVEIRSDISFVTSVINWFTKNPGHQYTGVVKTIFYTSKALRSEKSYKVVKTNS